MKIFIDAGHNYSGADTGAFGNGLKEQEITFYISDKLKSLLVAEGHKVKMSRNKMEDNLGKTLNEGLNLRAKMANEWGADLFVSIHCNAFDGKARGTEVLVYSLKSKSVDTAKKIQKAIVKNLGTIDRGVKERPNLCVLRKTSMPALLVETAFIDNVADAQALAYRNSDFAEAIFEGITGKKAKSDDLTEIEDIISELSKREIITDKALWSKKLKEDENAYWLARKCVNYIRGIDL